MKKLYLFFFLLFLNTQAFAAFKLEEAREHFVEVYEKIKQGNSLDFQAYAAEYKDYILYPYLEYAYLKSNIDKVKDSELIIFMKRYPQTVLSEEILNEWIKRLAEEKHWLRILNYYNSNTKNLATQCFYNEALIYTGQTQRGIQQGKQLWLSKVNPPKECQGLFNTLKAYKQLTEKDYWQRIALLMDKNKVSKATRLAQNLSGFNQKLFNNWVSIYKNPKKYLPRYLEDKFRKVDTPEARQIIVHSIKRYAKKNHIEAATLWRQLKPLYQFTPQEIGNAEGYIYTLFAKKHDANALSYLSQIPASFRSKEANLWLARIALRTANWQAVLDAIQAMDTETQQDGAWIYWKAKALEQLGKSDQANQLFSKNAKNATFYGFLSADHLKQPYDVLNQQKPDRSAAIQKVKRLLGIQRALELFRVGKPDLASKEWLYAIKNLNKQDKLAAAELALQNGQAFTAIVTVSKTKDWNVVDLRFPLLYQQLVLQNAKQHNIDPAWVYGVIRRESAFKVDALSRVKAFGLMQLMPKTAKYISRSIGLKRVKQSDFVKPEINIQLGTSYLSKMLNRFDGNYPKATAAYNAGPGRIPKWAASYPMAANRWIESIPFNETRKYVRGVLAYTTIYDHKLKSGKGKRLSQRLMPILPEEPN